MSNLIITIDGPAGSGKSTVARKLATRLGFIHLNSGALYRVIGVKAEEGGLSLEDEQAICALARRTNFDFKLDPATPGAGNPAETRLLVEGEVVPEEVIGTSHAGFLASRVGLLPQLRQILNEVQRRVAQSHSLVLEGRDAGTVVFPNADFKFYLDASIEVRARRRFEQLEKSQSSPSLEQITRDLIERDNRDKSREIAPDIPAADAVIIDTGPLGIDEVVESIRAIVQPNVQQTK